MDAHEISPSALPLPFKTFGEWVKHARNAKKWSQAKLAGRSFCSLDTIRAIEQNRTNYRPSLEMAARLAVCLEIPDAQREQFITLARAHGLSQNSVTPTVAVPAPIPELAALPAQPTRVVDAVILRRFEWRGAYGWAVATIVVLLGLVLGVAIPASAILLWGVIGNAASGGASSGFVALAPREPRISVEANGKLLSNGDEIPRNSRVTVTFVIVNRNSSVVRLAAYGIAGRGPCVAQCTWNSPHASFEAVFNPVLQPGQSVEYQATRLFNEPGAYFVEPFKQDRMVNMVALRRSPASNLR